MIVDLGRIHPFWDWPSKKPRMFAPQHSNNLRFGRKRLMWPAVEETC